MVVAVKAINRTVSLMALCCLLCLSGCYNVDSIFAIGPGKLFAKNTQCVAYARKVSGINIYGDAHTWWHSAPKYGYSRGKRPMQGAVLVLSKTSKLHWGHVVVVENINNSREIEVNHVNWGSTYLTRRTIYDDMKVRDVSKHNDWSMVRFMNEDSGTYGIAYEASGFVYP